MGTGSFLGVKWPGRDADYLPLPCAEVKVRIELYLCFSSGSSWTVLIYGCKVSRVKWKITQNSVEVDAEIKESTRKTEEKLDGRYKGGHEQKKPK